jgi:hypothetical protein
MIPKITLHIHLNRSASKPAVGSKSLSAFHGGPDVLLAWLETQLGLARVPVLPSIRITEYAAALDSVSGAGFAASLAADRWATATELLARRDELRLSGWNERVTDGLPPLVRDLARAADSRQFAFIDETARLETVLEALRAGQSLPTHECILLDHAKLWPRKWQEVFEQLEIVDAPSQTPRARVDSSLRTVQDIVLGQRIAPVALDKSFRHVVVLSETVACEFVAALLRSEGEDLGNTVIYCEDDAIATRLDGGLQRSGMPTMGVASSSTAHPVLQVLPLCLSLCWEPVDPQLLLDFLTLPVSPLPRGAAIRLAHALTEQPGLGSHKWDTAWNGLCHTAADPDGSLQSLLRTWLFPDRRRRGMHLPSSLVSERCRLVAQWAAGRSAMMTAEAGTDVTLADALTVAAGQAAVLAELVGSQGAHISEPQLSRLVEEVLASGVRMIPFQEVWRGPQRVASLAEIVAPCQRLIWLGLGTQQEFATRWSNTELRQLRAAGIDVDDGSRRVAALRAAEARGLAQVEQQLLTIWVPSDADRPYHPFWLAIRNSLPDQVRERPPILDELIACDNWADLDTYRCPTEEIASVAAPRRRPQWVLPAGLLQDRETVSASELQDRLGCPLKWVLNYQAKLRPSSIALLPDLFQLKGTFCHDILERVFGAGGQLPSATDVLARVADVFDSRLPLDAAPLALPDQATARAKLREEILSAVATLMRALESGGYRIRGIEVEVEGTAFGKAMTGWIDCVAVRDDGSEAIIDFKYAGRSKYRALLERGRAVQLATYAHSRSRRDTARGTYPAVAYLVIADAQLLTPAGSPLAGNDGRVIVDGPAIRDVWDGFVRAIEGADTWLTGGQPTVARPLQAIGEWPAGAELVLDSQLPADQHQEVCRYCDYKRLCGLEEMT